MITAQHATVRPEHDTTDYDSGTQDQREAPAGTDRAHSTMACSCPPLMFLIPATRLDRTLRISAPAVGELARAESRTGLALAASSSSMRCYGRKIIRPLPRLMARAAGKRGAPYASKLAALAAASLTVLRLVLRPCLGLDDACCLRCGWVVVLGSPRRAVLLHLLQRIADAGEVRSWLPSSGARGAVRGVGKRPRNWYQAVLPRGETHRRAIEAISRSGSNSTNDLAVAHRNRAMDGHQAVTHSSCRFWCKRMLRSILTFSVRDLHRLSRVRPRANPITVCISLAMLYDISTTVPGGRSGSEGDPCQPGAVAQRQQAH